MARTKMTDEERKERLREGRPRRVYCPMRDDLKTIAVNLISMVWNHGGPIALKHVLVPFFMSIYDEQNRTYQTGFVFGIRIFRCQVLS